MIIYGSGDGVENVYFKYQYINGRMHLLLARHTPRAGLLVEALRASPHQAGGGARATTRSGRRGGVGSRVRRGRGGRRGGSRLQAAVRLAAYRDGLLQATLQLVKLLMDPRELLVAVCSRRRPLRPRGQPRRVASAAAQRRRGGSSRRPRPARAGRTCRAEWLVARGARRVARLVRVRIRVRLRLGLE